MKKRKNCIIYGGGGFIGSHICEELLNDGYNVSVFDKLYFDKRNISSFRNRVKVIEGDFYNEKDIKKSLKGQDIVFHLVSSTLPANSNLNPAYDVETNLIATIKMLDRCREYRVSKVIFISSGGTVYGIPEKVPTPETFCGKPICSYGIVKKTIEDYLFMYNRLYGLDYNVFRLANPYGERQNPFVAQGVIPVFLMKLLKRETINIWGDGSITRDYIYIKDAVDCMLKSLEVKSRDKLFNLGSGRGYSLNEILDTMKKVTGIKPKVKYLHGRDIDVPVNILNIRHAKKTFNWKPKTGLELGIYKTYHYLKENYGR
jgi:UDP-glucose 4-epimerase